MIRKSLWLLMAVAVVALAAVPALAAPPATLILVSGERVRGLLVDMGGVDFTMSVGGDERRIPIGEVAVIDFVGGGQGIPATETSKLQSGRHLVFMRGGDYWYGNLYDVGGNDPLRITVNTQDGRREVLSSDIGRIYMRRWEGMPVATVEPPTPPTQPSRPTQPTQPARPTTEPPQAAGIAIPASGGWVNTNVQVRAGQMVAFTATGEVTLSDDANDKAGPAGAYSGRTVSRGAPMPGVAQGALVARVGSSYFAIGNQTQALRMPDTGVVFLTVNDDSRGDNRGEFRVQITVR